MAKRQKSDSGKKLSTKLKSNSDQEVVQQLPLLSVGHYTFILLTSSNISPSVLCDSLFLYRSLQVVHPLLYTLSMLEIL